MSPSGDIAQQLLTCLEAAFEDSANDTPGSICLRVGEVPFSAGTHEDLCCTGLAWVRIVRIFPSTDFPQEDNTVAACPASGRAVELEMGVVRCLPDHGTESGATCEEWTAAFLTVDEDSEVMARALCCMQDTLGVFPVGETFLPGEWAPIDGQGGCIGGTMNVTYSYDCSPC